MKLRVEVVIGPEGPALYVNDIRLAGPKPWGGGTVTHKFDVDLDRLREVLREAEER